ncbi:MAG: class I SAM-dependent methyltransferase [Acidobacteriota bacterium]
MAFFDSFAEIPPTGAGWWILQRLNRHHLETLKGLSPGMSRVVEIGPGLGAFAGACKDASLRYTAVEPNARMGAVLKRAGHPVVSGFVPPMPFAERSVDVVHASHVIEHNPTFREAIEFVQECRRVVRVGGLVSLLGPDFDHLGNYFFKADYSHSLPVNRLRLTALMTDCGLRVRHAGYLSGPFHGPLRWLTQTLAKLSTPGLIWLLTLGRLHRQQCYSAKSTFMRAIWVVGERVA